MSPQLQHALLRINAWRQEGRTVALLMDYDGTLAPITTHPRLATLAHHTRMVLEQLSSQAGLALGFLSGRRLNDLKTMVGLPGAYYVGTGGLEIDLRGIVHVPAETATRRKLLASLLQPLDNIVAYSHGAWLENKELGLTVHYRAVARERIPVLLQELTQLLAPLRDHLRVMPGPMALEITADMGWTKATALRTILGHVNAATMPVYAGDSANDEDALREAMALGGIALWVGAKPSPITPCHLESPAHLADFLRRLVKVAA
jgi:trehalose-phosphatase